MIKIVYLIKKTKNEIEKMVIFYNMNMQIYKCRKYLKITEKIIK